MNQGYAGGRVALRTLSDSPVLAPLARVAERVGVDLVLFGSVATRALLFDAALVQPADLFELVEHAADIDLAHTGPASATLPLRAAIADLLPMAPWFRWSIIDRDESARLERLRPFNISVPLRQLRIGTEPRGDVDGISELLARALHGEVDIHSNEAFRSSPRSGYDTEASAVLLYIDTWLDVLEVQKRSGRPARVRAHPSANDLMGSGLARLATLSAEGRSIALRRLWYRLASTGMRMPPDLFEAMRDTFNLTGLVTVMEDALYPAGSFGRTASAPTLLSSYVGDEAFRVPSVVKGGFGEYHGWLDEALGRVSIFSPSDGMIPAPMQLGEGNEVIAAVCSIPLRHGGNAPSIFDEPLAQDFIHVALPASRGELDDIVPEKLTAVVMANGPHGTLILPAFSSVSTALPFGYPRPQCDRVLTRSARCTVRLNVGGMINHIEKLDVFLVKGNWE